jgi:prevent-host-death family protein
MGNPYLNKLAEDAPDIGRISLKEAEANFEQVVNEVLTSGEPVSIKSGAGSAVLVSEKVWRGMTETLNLVSIPGMRGSIRAGMREHTANTTTDLDW